MIFNKIKLFIQDFLQSVNIIKKIHYQIIILQNQLLKIQRQLYNCQIQQKQLKYQYQYLLENNKNLPKFSDVGYRVFSQSDEDGLLNYIFSLIGTTNKICLEIAYPSPYDANTTNLIVNDNWKGILICGKKSEKREIEIFFSSYEDTFLNPPIVYHKWITMENVNEVVKKGLDHFYYQGNQIDLFSLDIDGVDYWIWKALEIIVPRVVVVEYQPLWSNRSVTVPYKSDFNKNNIHPQYFGATLQAFVKLAKNKGYRLVGSNHYGYNAFFVKNGIAEDILPEVSYKECLFTCKHDEIHQGELDTKNLGWIDV